MEAHTHNEMITINEKYHITAHVCMYDDENICKIAEVDKTNERFEQKSTLSATVYFLYLWSKLNRLIYKYIYI